MRTAKRLLYNAALPDVFWVPPPKKSMLHISKNGTKAEEKVEKQETLASQTERRGYETNEGHRHVVKDYLIFVIYDLLERIGSHQA